MIWRMDATGVKEECYFGAVLMSLFKENNPLKPHNFKHIPYKEQQDYVIVCNYLGVTKHQTPRM